MSWQASHPVNNQAPRQMQALYLIIWTIENGVR